MRSDRGSYLLYGQKNEIPHLMRIRIIYVLRNNMGWDIYNPEWLAQLAETQLPEERWLPEAIRKCTKYYKGSDAYYYFVSPKNPNMPGSEWQHDRSIIIKDEYKGIIVLDILKDNRVGGVEFLDKI
jgi:hypothetical protein